jgi:hypothetical protein
MCGCSFTWDFQTCIYVKERENKLWNMVTVPGFMPKTYFIDKLASIRGSDERGYAIAPSGPSFLIYECMVNGVQSVTWRVTITSGSNSDPFLTTPHPKDYCRECQILLE